VASRLWGRPHFPWWKKVDGQVCFIGAVCKGASPHMEGLEKLRVGIDHGHGLATGLAKVSERHVADCHIVHRHMVNRGEGMSGSEEVHGGEEGGKPCDALAALWVSSGHHEDGPIDLPRLNAERNLVWRRHLVEEEIHLAFAAGFLKFLDDVGHDGLLKKISGFPDGDECDGTRFQTGA